MMQRVRELWPTKIGHMGRVKVPRLQRKCKNIESNEIVDFTTKGLIFLNLKIMQ